MEKILYILHPQPLIAETLVWTLQLGTELKAISIADPEESNQPELKPDLVLIHPEIFEKISAIAHSKSFPVLLIASHPEEDHVLEALYAGANDLADLSKGPEEILEKVNQLLFHHGQETNSLVKRLIEENKRKDRRS